MAAGPSIEHSTIRTPASRAAVSSGAMKRPLRSWAGETTERVRPTAGSAPARRSGCRSYRSRTSTRRHDPPPGTPWPSASSRRPGTRRPAASGCGRPRVACTPPFGDDQTELRIEHTDLVVASRGRTRRAPITTLGAAAALVGTAPEADTGVYTADHAGRPRCRPPGRPASATVLAEWFAFAAALLDEWRAERTARDAGTHRWPSSGPSTSTSAPTWAARVTAPTTARPRATPDPEPYLYVGPWITRRGRVLEPRHVLGAAVHGAARGPGSAGARAGPLPHRTTSGGRGARLSARVRTCVSPCSAPDRPSPTPTERDRRRSSRPVRTTCCSTPAAASSCGSRPRACSPGSLHRLYLTHLHSDHTTDVNDVITMRWAMSPAPNPLPVVGPPGTQTYIDRVLTMLTDDIGYRRAHHDDLDWDPAVEVTEVTSGEIDERRRRARHRRRRPTTGRCTRPSGTASSTRAPRW